MCDIEPDVVEQVAEENKQLQQRVKELEEENKAACTTHGYANLSPAAAMKSIADTRDMAIRLHGKTKAERDSYREVLERIDTKLDTGHFFLGKLSDEHKLIKAVLAKENDK